MSEHSLEFEGFDTLINSDRIVRIYVKGYTTKSMRLQHITIAHLTFNINFTVFMYLCNIYTTV